MTIFDQRDETLCALRKHYPDLIALAFDVAVRLAQRDGRVTSTELRAELVRMGYGEQVDAAANGRVLGPVFSKRGCWQRVGWEPTGSKGRPVAIWRLAE